jgi:hypothetical protein
VISERDDRRNYRQTWPRIVPAVVEIPIRGLLTGHDYITRFIDTTWRSSCATLLPK